MRSHWIAAIAAVALLGACDKSGQNPAGQAQTAPAIAPGTTITGTVNVRDQIAIAAGAKLDVKLIDIATPELPVAEKTIEVSGTPPYTFALDFDPSRISAARTYVITAVLNDGPRRFMPALNSPVLTMGSGTTTEVVLNAEATPAEKLKEAFEKLQAQIGGMKSVDGTYTTDTASIGWDAFAKNNVVQFVRVNTVLDAGGRSAVHYAFKEGKVMVVKERRGSTVGWNDAGEVLWNEKAGGGEVDEAGIAAMHADALRVLEMAQAKFDAGKRK
jgi:putative lipoprotein